MIRLRGASEGASARKARDPGLNTGPGENFSLKVNDMGPRNG